METQRRAGIRKHRWNIWRGYIGGVRAIEFGDSSHESAEQAAERWLEEQNSNKHYIPKVQLVGCESFNPYALIVAIQAEMIETLSSSDYRKHYALHEAGHYLFFIEAGIQEFVFTKPRITILKNKPCPEMAGVIPIFNPDELKFARWQDGANALARAASAGGQFSRYFAPATDPGDERDYANFVEQCETWRRQGFPVDTAKFWKDGQDHVRVRLQDAEFITKARKTALELEGEFYPLGN